MRQRGWRHRQAPAWTPCPSFSASCPVSHPQMASVAGAGHKRKEACQAHAPCSQSAACLVSQPFIMREDGYSGRSTDQVQKGLPCARGMHGAEATDTNAGGVLTSEKQAHFHALRVRVLHRLRDQHRQLLRSHPRLIIRAACAVSHICLDQKLTVSIPARR